MNFYTALKPLFFVLRLIGLAPYTFVTVQGNDGSVATTVQNSWIANVYSICFTLLLCICILVSLTGRVRYTYLTLLEPDVVPDFLVWCTLSICACSSLILSFVFRKRMARVLHTVSQVDRNLLVNLTRTYNNTFLITITILVIVFCFISALICTFFLWTVELSGIESMILVLPGYIIYFVNNFMVLLYVCLVTLIWHRYRALNSHLTNKNISYNMQQALNMSHNVSAFQCHHSGSKKNSKAHTLHCNGNGCILTSVVTEQYEVACKIDCDVSNIRRLREFHDTLHDVASDINMMYGFQILADIFNTFIDSVATSYLSIVYAKKQTEGGDNITYHGLIVNTNWILLFFIKMIAVTLSCHFASNEANGTARILHKKLLTEELKQSTEKEIQFFLQQVTNNKLYFSACGFFHINLSTLCTMVSSVATYLVILFQF